VRVYIAGTISLHNTLPTEKVEANRRAFHEAEVALRAKGFDVVNPLRLLGKDSKMKWSERMRVVLVALLGCQAIHLLPRWEESPAARVEFRLACDLGMEIVYL
jgi:hypothetical protein